MEYLACPSCGSTYFLSSRNAGKIVFHVGVDNRPVMIDQQQNPECNSNIDVSQIFCGACSWFGKIEQLLASHI